MKRCSTSVAIKEKKKRKSQCDKTTDLLEQLETKLALPRADKGVAHWELSRVTSETAQL